jgi:uncharacterized damage-inducible protein DinB
MPELVERLIVPAPDFPSREVGSFFAQLDDQTRRLSDDTRGMTPAELQWQPAPGNNTIGMLLAHLAIVDVFWYSIAAEVPFDCRMVLGIGEDDDGMPCAEGAGPPATLAGKDLAYYDDLIARGRRYTKQLARGWSDADLDHRIERTRPNGTVTIHHRRWIVYHVLEHFSGHYGQILLLRHLHRDAAGKPAAV